MRKHLIVFFTAIIIFAVHLHIPQVSAQTSTPTATIKTTSASLKRNPVKTVEDKRVQHLKAYLEQYESPLSAEAETFVIEADKYNIDYRLLPAIAGVESWFGTRLPENSYNGWGWGIYGGKVHYFSSWEDAIQTISGELRNKYMNKWGAKDVYGIGRFYASDPAWAYKVTNFMNDIEEFEAETQNNPISISL